MKKKANLYDKIGQQMLEAIIRDFYESAFNDMIIGHFFFHHSHEGLIQKQIRFSRFLLGGGWLEISEKPPSMAQVHQSLNIRPAHFDRRRKLLEAAMNKNKLEPEHKAQWLRLEDRLRNRIVSPS